ncbi:restriction endonuclease fold toxin-2 domain-containing protein [Archangium violaceum]|uniref:restriction endonuclease fold toxin-2 domain-containing protein n=1 Tax=Archangium violaceum TaxID=83451 RepID=UPI0036DE188C
MEKPEKLCRAFVRAMEKMPGEAMNEVQAVLSPESMALMGTMTMAWIGSQGIPVLGQAVDVALLSLGVMMAAAQTAAVKDSLWLYVNSATHARDEAGLDTAATHLARAVATVGVSVVTFILMKKVSGNVQNRPGPRDHPALLPEPLPVAAGGRVGAPVGAAPGVVPGTGVTPAFAAAGGRSVGGGAPTEEMKPKKVNLKAFKQWIGKVKRRPARENSEAYKYQRKHAGPEEMEVSGGGERVWADGARLEEAKLLEVKHIGDAERSPFIAGSKCVEKARTMILNALMDEFARYAAVVRDPNTPVVGLEVIVNDSRAVALFEQLLKNFSIPGEVVVRP